MPTDSPLPGTTAPRRRRRWLRTIGVIIGIVALVLGGLTLRQLWRAGAFRTITPHFAGSCRLIEGPVGAEDITIDQRTGIAYVSATDRRAAMAGRPVPGGVWRYDLSTAGAEPANLTPDAGVEFQPHGISLWPQPDGSATLFVISHPAAASGWPSDAVEIADVRDGRWQHRATLTDPRLIMPNDLVAVGPDRFYLTNTHVHRPGLQQNFETYLALPTGNVLFYGPGGFRIAAEHIRFANGINVSPDGRTVYVDALTQGDVLVFDRDPATNVLTPRDRIPIASGVDNVEVDPDGTLWIGAHPKLLDVASHAKDPAVPAPAQVVRVDPSTKRVDEVYLSDGKPLSAASVGAHYRNRLLIGAIFDAGFLDCEMTGP